MPNRALSCLACIGILASVLSPVMLQGKPIPVLHREGTVRGFLLLRDLNRKTLAAGDLIEVSNGTHVTSELVFHFRDGSIDDETTVFEQKGQFSLVRDHHVQRGPAFKHSTDMLIDVPSGNVTVKDLDPGKDTAETKHMDLPPDLVNGLMLTILKNVPAHVKETVVSYMAMTPEPRIVKLKITEADADTFTVAGRPYKATRFVVKADLGGIAGFVAPIIGKQPKDWDVWVVGGKAPAFVKSEGPLALGGPLWTIEMTSPTWPQADTGDRQSR